MLSHRFDLADLCNTRGLTKAVEVGVHQSVFSYGFMLKFNGTLTCIDPWSGVGPDHPTFYPNYVAEPLDRDHDMRIAQAVMSRFGDRITFMRETSESAAAKFADGSLDMVYLDGLHDLPSVKQDLHMWWPKVKSTGIISGHDYLVQESTLCGVAAAVMCFAYEHNVGFQLTGDSPPSWWMVKP